MSKDEWEHGTIKLPSAAFTQIRKAMEDGAKRDAQVAFDQTQVFWKGLSAKQRRDPQAFRSAAYDFAYGPPHAPGGRSTSQERPHAGHVYGLLLRATDSDGRPRRVLKADVDFPSNRTTRFRVGSEASVTFDRDRSTVTWDVPENNHAVESAHEHPTARRFFAELAKVRWTRDTGGVLAGNDEYNRDGSEVGGGQNYATIAFGPIGAETEPWRCAAFTDSKGVRHTLPMIVEAAERARVKAERARRRSQSSGQGRVQRGVPTGGRFTGVQRSESDLRL